MFGDSSVILTAMQFGCGGLPHRGSHAVPQNLNTWLGGQIMPALTTG